MKFNLGAYVKLSYYAMSSYYENYSFSSTGVGIIIDNAVELAGDGRGFRIGYEVLWLSPPMFSTKYTGNTTFVCNRKMSSCIIVNHYEEELETRQLKL